MSLKAIIVITLIALSIAGCGSEGASSNKQVFYQKALTLAEESLDGYSHKRGPWVTPMTEAQRSTHEQHKQKIASLDERLSVLRQRQEKHFSESPLSDEATQRKYPILSDLTTVGLDNNKNGKVETNELPQGVYQDEYSVFHYTDAAQQEIDAWEAQCERLESEIRELENQKTTLMDERADAASEQTYLMTIGDIKAKLGKPDSILKVDSDEQVWVYRFSDGAVRITVQQYSGDTSLDQDKTLALINPQEVELH